MKALKYHDLNADGDQDTGESGLQNWTIFIDKDADETLDTGETNVQTDANGEADFGSSVPAGTYSFCEQLKADWLNSDPTGTTLCKSVTVGTGAASTVKFGNFQQATKSGIKFHDRNGDGDQDAGEEVLQNWTIKLSGTDGGGNAVDLTDVTDANGAYSFTVNPGDYLVCEIAKTGWTQTAPAASAGDCSGVTGAAANGWDITLTSGQTDSGNDFANRELYRLIVLTCSEATGQLIVSSVDLGGVVKDTIVANPTGTTGDLCALGGASYPNLTPGTYNPAVTIPK